MVTKNISTFVTSVLQVLISIWVLLEISWQLTLLALVVMPMTFAIWRRLLAPLRRGDRKVLEQSGEVTSHLQETVSGVRQVKAAAAENFEAQRFRGLTETYFGNVVRTERIRALAGTDTAVIAVTASSLSGEDAQLLEHPLAVLGDRLVRHPLEVGVQRQVPRGPAQVAPAPVQLVGQPRHVDA